MTTPAAGSGGFDTAPGLVSVTREELPPLPDDILGSSDAGRIDPRRWFPDPSSPLEIEIGCGKGTFILNEAKDRPETNFLGFEWEYEFFSYACDRIRRSQIHNVRMLHADAVEFLRWRCPSAIVRTVHLYFSDPWPKKRHHKRRVVQDAFLKECHRILAPDGELRIVTDHSEYWAWMQEHIARVTPPAAPALFERRPFERPASAGEGELVGTNFERKYRREGRPFHSVVLRKLPAPPPAPLPPVPSRGAVVTPASEVSLPCLDMSQSTTPAPSPAPGPPPESQPDSLPISEAFYSIQGEGKLTGVPSYFIRTSGCNLRCRWCDTPYASWNPDGQSVPISQLVDQVRQSGARHVVLTGGEPMMFPQLAALATRLRREGFHITIETAGTIDRDDVPCDLMSISPKLAGSTPEPGDPRDPAGAWRTRHDARRINLPALSSLLTRAPESQLKFVVTDESDVAEIDGLLASLRGWSPSDILLMPEGVAPPPESLKAMIVRECLRRGWRYCTRLHLDLFGNRRGT